MHLEHVFRDVQTDRGSLLYGRLLRWQFDTVTLAHKCRRGASTPSPRADLWPTSICLVLTTSRGFSADRDGNPIPGFFCHCGNPKIARNLRGQTPTFRPPSPGRTSPRTGF